MSYDYIVVGGGISGLNTALKLCNGKNKVLVLERNNRLGGRLETYNNKKIKYEIGGARFHKGHKKLFELIKMFNLEDKIFHIPNDITFIPIKSKFKKKYNTNKIIDKILENSSSLTKKELLSTNITKLCSKLLTNLECKYFIESFEYISEIQDLNAYEAINTFKNDLHHTLKFYLFKNGFIELINLMEKFLKDNNCDIKLNHTLRNIKKTNETYQLEVKNILDNKSFKTKNLILALDKVPLLSLPYLKSIKPILENVKSIPLLRIYAIYPHNPKTKKVWFHDLGKITTDLEIKYIIPYNPSIGLIMISYTDQILAEYWNKIANQGLDKLELELTKQLNKLFPNKKIPKTSYLKAHYWPQGFHSWKKNKESDIESKKILQPFPKEKLYICGESYSQRQGWVEGALETSEEVIKLINNIKTNKKQQKGGVKKNKTKKIKYFTKKEVSKHNKPDDLWIIIKKNVLDVTEWQHSHPGSPMPIQAFGGKDATKAFLGRGHSNNAKKLMKKFIIGKIK
tara:strand:+ start:316 stop:1851 length:1536 start_codon:yes stop_codon:yes gene_type:complete